MLRHQLIVLRRRLHGRARLTNSDRWFFIHLYRWFPSILQVLTIIRPETLVGWHRAGFRHYWRWKSRSPGGRPQIETDLRALIRRMSMDNPCMGLSLSSAKFATRYLSTCSGWFDVRGPRSDSTDDRDPQSILVLSIAGCPIWPRKPVARNCSICVAPARALVCQEVFLRSTFLLFLRFNRGSCERSSALMARQTPLCLAALSGQPPGARRVAPEGARG